MNTLSHLITNSTNTIRNQILGGIIICFFLYIAFSISTIYDKQTTTLSHIKVVLENNVSFSIEESNFLHSLKATSDSFDFKIDNINKSDSICGPANCYSLSFFPLYLDYITVGALFLISIFLIRILFNYLNKKVYSTVHHEIKTLSMMLITSDYSNKNFKTKETADLISILKKKEGHLKLLYNSKELAHDMQSPITALEMYLEDDPDELINLVLSNLKLMNRKILKSDTSRKIENINLYQTLKETAKKAKVAYPKINITLTPFSNEIVFSGDKLEWERAIFNILKNSYEECHDTCDITVKQLNSNQKSIIQIKDNGKGFPKEVIDFFGIKNITIGKKDGNGLGLYQVFNTVQKSDFDIRIYNKNGAVLEIINNIGCNKKPIRL
jgi:hypothetical protein